MAYRGTVYRYLLGVSLLDKSTEMTLERMQEEDFLMLEKASRQPISASYRESAASLALLSRGHSKGSWEASIVRERHLACCLVDHARRKRFESLLRVLQVAHAHEDLCQEDIDIILSIAVPFESIFGSAHEVFACVEALLAHLRAPGNPLSSPEALREHCGHVLRLLHALNEPLYKHFIRQYVPPSLWLPSMLCTLFAGNMAVHDTLRLWDVYLADAVDSRGVMALHPFVILAIFAEYSEELREMDCDGILDFCQNIPHTDICALLHQACRLRQTYVDTEQSMAVV